MYVRLDLKYKLSSSSNQMAFERLAVVNWYLQMILKRYKDLQTTSKYLHDPNFLWRDGTSYVASQDAMLSSCETNLEIYRALQLSLKK